MGAKVYIRGMQSTKTEAGEQGDFTPWSDEIRVEAVNQFNKIGNMREVSRILKVPYVTLKQWRKSAWWDEYQRAIRGEADIVLSHRVERMMEKAFGALEERLDKGDTQYNPVTGEFIRVPVKAQVINAITANLHKQRIELANQPTEHQMHDKDATAAKLKELATAFTAFVKGKSKEEVLANNEFEVLTDGTIIDGNGDIVDPSRITNREY